MNNVIAINSIIKIHKNKFTADQVNEIIRRYTTLDMKIGESKGYFSIFDVNEKSIKVNTY